MLGTNFRPEPVPVSSLRASYNGGMGYPIKVCAVCGEEFELKPGKPGFANRCPSCSEEEAAGTELKKMDADERRTVREANEERRSAMRNLLYRKDS